jgi:integrase
MALFSSSVDREAHLGPATARRYEGLLRRHLLPALRQVPLDSLGLEHLRGLYDRLLRDLSPGTVRLLHFGTVLPALERAAREGLAPRNVATAVDLPEPAPAGRASWTLDEARRFLRAIAGDRLEALYVLAMTAGLRQGELLGLRWRDLDRGELSVRQVYRRGVSGRAMAAPGRRTPPRPLALSQAAVEALRRRQRRQAEERRRAGAAWAGRDLVFCGPRGGSLNPAFLRDSCLYPLLARAGLARLRFADLSHAAATLSRWEPPTIPAANRRPRREHARDTGDPGPLSEGRDDCGPVVVRRAKKT